MLVLTRQNDESIVLRCEGREMTITVRRRGEQRIEVICDDPARNFEIVRAELLCRNQAEVNQKGGENGDRGTGKPTV
jgi:sRNA-binding carbon storage regulator CsrA